MLRAAPCATERLKRKRYEYEEQNKEDILRRQREAEAARRQEESASEQRKLVSHILAHHRSYFEVLNVRTVTAGPLCAVCGGVRLLEGVTHAAVPQCALRRPYIIAVALHARSRPRLQVSETVPVFEVWVSCTGGVQIPEDSAVDVIKRARKQMSFRVHPDRCKLPQAKDAFHKVNEAAEALLSHRV